MKKLTQSQQRIAIAILIIIGAIGLTGFSVGEYNPNHWNDTVRLSFAISVILAIVVSALVHKIKEREEALKTGEMALKKALEELKHNEGLVNGPAFRIGEQVTEVLHKNVMHQMNNVNDVTVLPEESQ